MKILAKFTSFLDHLGHGVLVVAGGLWRTRKKTFLWLKKTALKIYTTIVAFLDWLGNLIIALVSFIISKIKHSRWGKTQFSKTLSLVWQRRHSKNRPVLWGAVFVLIIFLPLALLRLKTPQETEAGWFNDGWGYRKSVAITNAGADQTDYQVAITLDTAALITAGKMQSDCDDIRITDHQGKVLPYWIEESGAYACNDSDTKIWTKAPSLPTSGATILVYYGNSSATSATSGDSTFEFFDDFSSPSIDSAKWTQGTIGTTTGTDFSQASGLLSDGNTNRYIQSTTAYTGNYAASTRVYTTTSAANGYTTVGFWASTSNNFGILDHNGTTYIRNDSSWPNYSYNGSGQWNRDEVRVTGTSATHWRTGETSGSTTAGNTNSGLSSEYLRLGARYDSSASNQNFVADWDWIFVRKTTTTEPSVGSPTNEEKSPAPVAHWKFDEGYGTTANDSSGQEKNGTFLSAPIWKTEDQCISGKCLAFDNVDDGVSITNQNFTSLTDYTMCSWVNPKGNHKNYTGTIMSSGDWNVSHWAFGISQNNATIQTRRADGTNSPGWNYSFPLSQWTYVCLTRSGATITAYANGKQVGSPYTGTTGNLISNATNTTIGRETYAGGYFAFNGFIDETKIYPYARTAAQIKSDYAGRGASEGVSTSFGASEQQNFLSEGLVGYWKMDEASGNAADSSGNSHTATLVNSPSYSGGKFGNSISLSTNQGATVASSTPLNSSYITASAWIYPTASSAELMITNKESSFEWALKSGALQWAMYTSSTVWYWHSTGYSPPLNQWTHVTLTYDGNNIITYANGEIKETFSYSGTIATSGVVNIGCRGGTCNTSYWSGKLDEVRIYNRALSPADVRDLYNWAPGSTTHYKFDGNANDASGSNLNFTTTKNYTPGKFGKALVFEGGTTGTTASTNILDTDTHTIEFWIQFTGYTSGWQGIFNYKPSGSDRSPGIWRHTSGRMLHWRYDAGNTGTDVYLDGVGSGTQFSDNTWYHVAGTKEGSAFKAYVNGSYVGSVSVANPKFSGSSPFYFGSAEVNIDDFRTYNYARTPDQIIEDMNAGHPIGGSPISSKVSHWKFDEGYGSAVNDVGVGGNNGTITGATWTNSGKFNKSLSFDGAGDYITVADDTSLRMGTDSFTISTWVSPETGGGAEYFVALKSTGGSYGFSIYPIASTRRIYTYLNDGTDSSNGYTGDSTLSFNEWTHVAVVFDRTAAKVKVYLNGVFDGDRDISAAIDAINPTGPLRLGYYNGTTYEYKGKIDEVKLYNTALTRDEILIDMNQGASSVMGSVGTDASGNASFSSDRAYCPPGDTTTNCAPIAEWKFDEKTGSTAQDTSGNGHTGTLTNLETNDWRSAAECKQGACLNFDAGNEYVDVGTSNQIDIAGDVTYETWMKITADTFPDNTTNWTFFNNESYLNYGTILRVDGASTRLYLRTNQSGVHTSSMSTSTLSNNTWYHIAVVKSGSSVTFYINGKSEAGTSSVNNPLDSSISMRVSNSGQAFNGLLDSPKIYDYARTPAQVAYDYNRGKPVGHWKLDECQGTTANDASGNGNNGTITAGDTSGSNDYVGTCVGSAGEMWADGATGKNNASLEFDGTNDYVTVGNLGSFYSQGTLSFWINADEMASYRNPLTTKYNGTNAGIRFEENAAGTFGVVVGNDASTYDSAVYISSGMSINTWYHIVYVWDTSNNWETGFLNGKQVFSNSHTLWPTTIPDLRIGTGFSTVAARQWSGRVDDVQIFNYALTPTQIKTLFNGSAIRFGPSEGAP